MSYELVKSSDNQIIFLSILVGLIFFFFILPNIENYNNINNKLIKEKFNDINDIIKIDTLPCSSSCCKYTVWPVPFNTVNPLLTKEENDKYIGSNLTCNTGKCICLTKNNIDNLSNHG